MPELDPHPLAALALRQLAAWEKLADGWETRTDLTTVERCADDDCRGGIFLLTDAAGIPYRYSSGDRLALVVNHLRSRHADLDPDTTRL